jgi:hypothetical protein
MNIEEAGNELILNATQRKFIDHFNRVGGNLGICLNETDVVS